MSCNELPNQRFNDGPDEGLFDKIIILLTKTDILSKKVSLNWTMNDEKRAKKIAGMKRGYEELSKIYHGLGKCIKGEEYSNLAANMSCKQL